MYEPSRVILSFEVAGFKHWDGATVINEIKVGEVLRLVPEPDNPYDPTAIAIYRGEVKLGHVPANCTDPLFQLLFYGHSGAFEARVQQATPENEPWHQLRVGVYVRDVR